MHRYIFHTWLGIYSIICRPRHRNSLLVLTDRPLLLPALPLRLDRALQCRRNKGCSTCWTKETNMSCDLTCIGKTEKCSRSIKLNTLPAPTADGKTRRSCWTSWTDRFQSPLKSTPIHTKLEPHSLSRLLGIHSFTPHVDWGLSELWRMNRGRARGASVCGSGRGRLGSGEANGNNGEWAAGRFLFYRHKKRRPDGSRESSRAARS